MIKAKCLKCGKIIKCNKINIKGNYCRKCYDYLRHYAPAIYKNKEWLKKQYYDNKLSFDSIAKLANCASTTVERWFKINNLKSRPAPYKGKCQRELNPSWKGGRCKCNGYIMRHHPEQHNYKNKGYYVYEHILVMEKKIGRRLVKPECIHHKNGNKSDNRPENLQLFKNNGEHRKYEEKLNSFAKEILFSNLTPNLKPQLLKALNIFLSKNE